MTYPSRQSGHSQPTVTTVASVGLYVSTSVHPLSPSNASRQWTATNAQLHFAMAGV